MSLYRVNEVVATTALLPRSELPLSDMIIRPSSTTRRVQLVGPLAVVEVLDLDTVRSRFKGTSLPVENSLLPCSYNFTPSNVIVIIQSSKFAFRISLADNVAIRFC